MKKLALALLLSAGLVNASFAKEATKNTDLDATIDDLSTKVDSKAQKALAWVKNNKKMAIALATFATTGVVVGGDYLIHWFKHDKEAETSVWEETWTKMYVVDKAKKLFSTTTKKAKKAARSTKKAFKNNKIMFAGCGIALVAAVLVAVDLNRDEKTSLIKQLFAKKADAPVVA